MADIILGNIIYTNEERRISLHFDGESFRWPETGYSGDFFEILDNLKSGLPEEAVSLESIRAEILTWRI